MPDASQLPQMHGGLFLTDGGIETSLIFHEGLDLPDFAAFVLLEDDEGNRGRCAATTSRTWRMARERGVGFVLESPTWRSSSRLGRGSRLLARSGWTRSTVARSS